MKRMSLFLFLGVMTSLQVTASQGINTSGIKKRGLISLSPYNPSVNKENFIDSIRSGQDNIESFVHKFGVRDFINLNAETEQGLHDIALTSGNYKAADTIEYILWTLAKYRKI